jgi:hypothetical protein
MGAIEGGDTSAMHCGTLIMILVVSNKAVKVSTVVLISQYKVIICKSRELITVFHSHSHLLDMSFTIKIIPPEGL